ncbi:hypothetical protein [Saccharothrix yanglingensis]|uniref:WXG100 family type VII secretion target n=1 Tax=Saccharothrix yanglingensis TaxID=659496 RepID=A0ABU0XA93_9PSEU|nr:hypothetical protein [Saccharothrix yanglingensis]MDQ2589057.1 hypothetical protein [Saccharothrix yanglingensis]
MTSFDINNNGYLDLNEQLLLHVRTTGDILQELNTVLNNISSATKGQATPLWLELQANWNRTYQEMQTKLNTNTMASINVHEIFGGGDNRGATIMLS